MCCHYCKGLTSRRLENSYLQVCSSNQRQKIRKILLPLSLMHSPLGTEDLAGGSLLARRNNDKKNRKKWPLSLSTLRRLHPVGVT